MKASFIAILASAGAVLANPVAKTPICVGPAEYCSLGCPSTTRPYALQWEQLQAVKDYSNLLFVQKNVSAGLGKYAAANLINHEPQVSGNGVATAISLLSGEIGAAQITVLREYVGMDLTGVVYGTVNIKSIVPVSATATNNLDVVNYFRMIGTCIVENWDVTQDVTTTNTVNPIAFYP